MSNEIQKINMKIKRKKKNFNNIYGIKKSNRLALLCNEIGMKPRTSIELTGNATLSGLI